MCADIPSNALQGTSLHVVVGNSGPTVARNVRVTFDPPLTASKLQSDYIENVQQMLASGLHSLAPGREWLWSLGAGSELLSSEEPQVRTVRVEGDGPYGPLPVLEFQIDISQMRLRVDAPVRSLHYVRKAIDDLTGAVSAVDSTVKLVLDPCDQSPE